MTNALSLLTREGLPAWVDPERMRERVEHPVLADGMDKPELWLLPADADKYPQLFFGGSADVYELLADFDSLAGTVPYFGHQFTGAVLYTSGWAAPLNEYGETDGAPSEHSERRRVYLAVCVTRDNAASRLLFADKCEVVDDLGTATGSLADAVSRCVASRLGGAE